MRRATGYFDDEETKDAVTKEHLDELRQSIEQQLDDIKAIIIANSGGLAEHLLGDDSELPDPGGDEQKMSEQIQRLKTLFKGDVNNASTNS